MCASSNVATITLRRFGVRSASDSVTPRYPLDCRSSSCSRRRSGVTEVSTCQVGLTLWYARMSRLSVRFIGQRASTAPTAARACSRGRPEIAASNSAA